MLASSPGVPIVDGPEYSGLSQAVLNLGYAQYWTDASTPTDPLHDEGKAVSRNGNWGWPFVTDQSVSPCTRMMNLEIAEIWLRI